MMQHGRHHLVDVGRADDPIGDDALDGAEDECAQLHGIDTQVEQGAPAEFRSEVPVVRGDGTAEPEVALDHERVPDPSLSDHVHQDFVRGQEPAPDCLHEEQPAAAGCLGHPRRLPRIEREWLLAQDVLPRPKELECVLLMARVRRCDVDDVDVGVGRQ